MTENAAVMRASFTASLVMMLAALVACASGTPDGSASSEAPAPGNGKPGAQRFELLSPVGEHEEAPTEARWRVGPGLMACRASFLSERMQAIWMSPPSDEGMIQIPAEVQEQFPAGTYQWRVVCSFSGIQIGSEMVSFSVRQP
jgi:hypothetical protein